MQGSHSMPMVGFLLLVAALGAYAAGPLLPFSASSTIDSTFEPEFAFDGDSQTRWASKADGGEAWLCVDLGEPVAINELRLLWEAAHAADYEVQVSQDGAAWTTLHHQTNGTGGEETISNLNGNGRFLRIYCRRPGPFGLSSLWEVSFPEPAAAAALERAQDQLGAIQFEATRAVREHLEQSFEEAGVREVVFAVRPLYPDGHWYANIAYFARDCQEKTYANGGGLYKFDVATEMVTPLIEDPDGTVRDPVVHYDGRTILFSYRKGGSETFHLYTIAADGTGLTQITSGEYDDFEPACLPDGGIVFVSTRCRRWVNCWLTQVAVVYRCDADGSNVMPLSANLEHDNTPWPMPDGRILYTRWEYVDRSQVDYHHLWTMNPDGTGQAILFGNMHPGGLYIDARVIPDSEEILLINSPGHGQREHVGHVALLDTSRGPDELSSLRNISDNGYRDPYPISSNVFLVARGNRLLLMNREGVTQPLFRLRRSGGLEIHEPRPIVARAREAVRIAHADYARTTGRMILAGAHLGRNMGGVAPGDIRKLLVVESLPKPINYTGGMDPLTYGGSFTLERILGTVPVEADGSAYFEVPANRAIFFVALDENDDSVKRMQSFVTVMPGETLGCTGCHEPRSESGRNPSSGALHALRRAPSTIEPILGIPEVFDFPRDIQPILDKQCVSCHDYAPHEGAAHGPRAGGVILSGDHGPMFSHSYANLTVRREFADGRDAPVSNYPPRSLGASASPIMRRINGGHHGVQLSAHEADMIRYWIETGATYPGTYAALGGGSIGGYYANEPVESDAEWPESIAAAEGIERRCAGCHTNEMRVPRFLSDENEVSFWRPEWNDPRLKRTRHLVFNLSRPEYSMMLLAPLARAAGGYGICGTPDSAAGEGAPVFAATTDPDYQRILAMCRAGKRRLETIKRFDMPGFQAPEPYIREMKRYQILPEGFGADGSEDYYAIDRAYWHSFDQQLALAHPAYTMR